MQGMTPKGPKTIAFRLLGNVAEATRLLKVCPVRALGAGVSGLGSGASGYEGVWVDLRF